MDKYKIMILCGESGTGKSFIKNLAVKNYPNIFHDVVTATSRPPREGEENGKDYWFLPEEEFTDEKMIEYCMFNNWYYGTPISSLSKDKMNLLVLNPHGIYRLFADSDKYDIQLIRFVASDKTRLLRQLNREEEPDVDEIVRRYSVDKIDFRVFDIDFQNDMFIIDTGREKAPNIALELAYIAKNGLNGLNKITKLIGAWEKVIDWLNPVN